MHVMHTIKAMQSLPHLATAELVRKARKLSGLNQARFGDIIGKSQGVVSRYEKGDVAPPGDVTMHCVNILGAAEVARVPPGSLDELVDALEGALALVRSIRDKQTDRT